MESCKLPWNQLSGAEKEQFVQIEKEKGLEAALLEFTKFLNEKMGYQTVCRGERPWHYTSALDPNVVPETVEFFSQMSKEHSLEYCLEEYGDFLEYMYI
jgi:hypothetical protein